MREASKRWYDKNRQAQRDRIAEWRKANPEKLAEQQAARVRTPEYVRRNFLWQKYKLSQDEYDALLHKQNGCCALCFTTTPSTHRKYFYVDHCHTTKRIRGLLCSECNRTLSKDRDNKEWLGRAIEYVEGRL